MRISSVKTVLWLAVNLHQVFWNAKYCVALVPVFVNCMRSHNRCDETVFDTFFFWHSDAASVLVFRENALWGFKALNLGSCLSTTVIYQFYIGQFWLLAFYLLCPLHHSPYHHHSLLPPEILCLISYCVVCSPSNDRIGVFGKVLIDGSACEFNLFSACSQGLCRARFVNPTLQTLEAFASCFINACPHCQARMIHHLIPARFCDIDCFPHYSNMIRTVLSLASKHLCETLWWTPCNNPAVIASLWRRGVVYLQSNFAHRPPHFLNESIYYLAGCIQVLAFVTNLMGQILPGLAM